jgi:drug/metabolite transporter (DMT)-like permease
MMSPRSEGLVLMGIVLVLSCGLQILLKQFATDLAPALVKAVPAGASRLAMLAEAVLNWRGVVIGVLGASLVMLWLMTLARLDLSLALPLAAVALAVNALVGGLALGETVGLLRIGGIAVITAGILLVVMS